MSFSIRAALAAALVCLASPALAADHAGHGDHVGHDPHAGHAMAPADHAGHTMASPDEMRKRMMKWIPAAEAKVGAKVDPNLSFVDQEGKKRTLGEFFDKPLIVTFVFTECPHICPTILTNLQKRVAAARAAHGDAFRVLTVSFDTKDDLPATMKQYGAGFTDDFADWSFGVAEADSVAALTGAFGFSFMAHPEEKWAHITMVTAVDKGGVVARQIFGTKVPEEEFNETLGNLLGAPHAGHGAHSGH
jgi:protein SCO1/2